MIAFRTDASVAIGTGHVMRCMALASVLRTRGANTVFLCRTLDGNLTGLLRASGHDVIELSPDGDDIQETLGAFQNETPEWVVVDHYGLDGRWERAVRSQVGKLMAIDDLADRPHECDVLVDQTYLNSAAERYAGLIPSKCVRLLGPRYAILKAEYGRRRRELKAKSGVVRRALVFFGGSDRTDMSSVAVEALSQPAFAHLAVDLVVGANNKHRTSLEERARKRPNTTIHFAREDLVDLMTAADIALGAGGTTTWERLCLGLPAIVVITAENQRLVSEALANAAVIDLVGDRTSATVATISERLAHCLAHPEQLTEMSSRGRSMVDGIGAERVAELLLPTPTSRLMMRPADQDDAELYFHWANDDDVRRNSMNSAAISRDTHCKWFREKLVEPHAHLFVLMAAGLPVGQIRFDGTAEEASIDYSLDRLVRGRGWAQRLVAMGMERQGAARVFHAVVKEGNRASRKVFERLGFTNAGVEQYGPSRAFRYHLSR